jgi:hypothetical protein
VAGGDDGSSWLSGGAGSQWRDRAGVAPGFLHCRRSSRPSDHDTPTRDRPGMT